MTGAPRRVAWLAAVAVLGAGCSRVPVIEVQAQPAETVSEQPQPTSSPTPTPSPTSPTPTDVPTSEAPRDPTDADRARFVGEYAPDDAVGIQHVATSVDGDDVKELVFAYTRDGEVARVDIAWWTGTAYEVGFGDDGGAGRSVDTLRVSDVNADGLAEVVTIQSGEGGRESASLWQVQGVREVARLEAEGGCHDGSHTYGVVGASVRDRDGDGAAEVEATCDDSPLPQAAWQTHTYVWQGGAYRYVPAEVDAAGPA